MEAERYNIIQGIKKAFDKITITSFQLDYISTVSYNLVFYCEVNIFIITATVLYGTNYS